jgi:hypothetical protein
MMGRGSVRPSAAKVRLDDADRRDGGEPSELMLEVSFEVSDGRTNQRNEPGRHDRALVSVVTVNLGGLRDLSEGLAT